MTVINLISPETLTRRAIRWRQRVWAMRLGGILLAMGLSYMAFLHLATRPGSEVCETAGRYSALQDRLRYAQDLIGERDRLAQRRTVIAAVRDSRPVGWFMEVLGRALPAESYLEFLAFDRRDAIVREIGGEPQGNDKPPSLRIRGRALGHKQVGEIIRQLNDSRAFAAVDLVSTREPQREPQRNEVEFELFCRLGEWPVADH